MKALLPPFLLLSLVLLISTCACANFHTTLVPSGFVVPNIVFEAGTNVTAYVISTNKTFAEVNVSGTLTETYYEYVLNITNLSSSIDYQAKLENVSITGINLLTNFTAYFRNETLTSKQVEISDGIVTQSSGPWYSVATSATIYLSLAIQVSAAGSTVDLRLHVVKSGTTSPEIIQTVTINVT